MGEGFCCSVVVYNEALPSASMQSLKCHAIAKSPLKQPKSLIVIGGGYIGCELGNFYAALGTKVTMFGTIIVE